MDESVRAALAKWPNVPHCTGWLLLDRRGQWRMRDDTAQLRQELGSPVRHMALIGFINRNYECDPGGQWFFQNGPQRVYVELAYTPWVVRLTADATGTPTLTDHTGGPFEPTSVLLDDEGAVLFIEMAASAARVALLHDHDLGLFSELATLDHDERTGPSGCMHWRPGCDLPLSTIRRRDVARRFAFVASPAHAAAAAVTKRRD